MICVLLGLPLSSSPGKSDICSKITSEMFVYFSVYGSLQKLNQNKQAKIKAHKTNLSDWKQRTNSLQRAELQPVGDFYGFQEELAPPVVAVLTYHPTAESKIRTVCPQAASQLKDTAVQKNAVSPAAVDSDRQDVVVEAFFHHAGDLRLRGDLSAFQALQTEQWDGGNCKRLHGGQVGVQGPLWRKHGDFAVRLLPHHCHSLDWADGEAGWTSHAGQIRIIPLR